MSTYRFVSLSQRPDLVAPMQRVTEAAWPKFMLEDAVADRFWNRLDDLFPEYQFALQDESGQPIALGRSIPIPWDGTIESIAGGWDYALEAGVLARERGERPTALCALEATVLPEHQGKGISRLILGEMRRLAGKAGLADLIAPVRPVLKPRYPLIPMDRYVQWTRADGSPFDPWIRVHHRLGASIVGIAERSMVISSSAADWERWTGMAFPDDGDYVVPGALSPVRFDGGTGTYVEPNVWMRHRVPAPG